MSGIVDFFKQHPVPGQVLSLILTVAVAAIVMFFLLRLEQKLAKKLLAGKDSLNLRYVENIGRFVLILVAVLWVMMSSPLTESFGKVLFQGTTILSAVAGFAAQPVIADMICGLILSATKPFDIGDRIELDDGTAGIVKDITLRHVVIQTIDTVYAIVPNSKLNAMLVNNMSYHTRTRSVHFRFNVGYDTDVRQAMAVIQRAVEESPYSIPAKPAGQGGEYGPVYFIACADSSLVMAITVYFEPTVATEVLKSDINTRVLEALNAAGIEIPYNYVSVVMRDGEKQE